MMRGSSPALRLGERLTTPTVKKSNCLEMLHRILKFGGIFKLK
jgi:hypothetical protein